VTGQSKQNDPVFPHADAAILLSNCVISISQVALSTLKNIFLFIDSIGIKKFDTKIRWFDF
jgi:hypothetical protein